MPFVAWKPLEFVPFGGSESFQVECGEAFSIRLKEISPIVPSPPA